MNMDPVMHDIQAYETSHLGPRVLFNTPLPMNPHHKRFVSAETHEHLAGQPIRRIDPDDQRAEIFRHAVWISCLYGKLGACRGQSLLSIDRQ